MTRVADVRSYRRAEAPGRMSARAAHEEGERRPDRRRPGSATPSEQNPAPRLHKAPPRARVLIADDERSIRALCRINLELAGIEVIEAADGEEALALIGRESPDVVLLDVMMPVLDGWHVAERLASSPALRELPVVFLTARASQDDRRRGFDLGGVDYILKPFDPIGLADRLERTLARLAGGEREQLRRELLEGS